MTHLETMTSAGGKKYGIILYTFLPYALNRKSCIILKGEDYGR
jgi:hypothetical protein